MSLRVAASASLVISQDNSSVPQETTFTSGAKSLIDTTTYSYSTGDTYKVAAGATDVEVDLGSLAQVEALFLMAKGVGISVKLVPMGGLLADTSGLTLISNFPTVIGAKIEALYVSNAGIVDVALVFGAAGN